jgi:hypothetical protein
LPTRPTGPRSRREPGSRSHTFSRAPGNPDERAQLLEEACELYEKKENTVLAERTRSLLEPVSSEAR